MISVAGLLLAGACGDDGESSTDDGSSDQGSETTSNDTSSDSSGTEGGVQCDGSSSTADCATYCASVLAADCPEGPGTQDECEQSCEMLNGVVGQCPAWGALVDCAQTAPTFTCFMGETVPEGCEEEF
jgi:hypothetical protein